MEYYLFKITQTYTHKNKLYKTFFQKVQSLDGTLIISDDALDRFKKNLYCTLEECNKQFLRCNPVTIDEPDFIDSSDKSIKVYGSWTGIFYKVNHIAAEKMKYMDVKDEELKRLFSVNSKIEWARVQVENALSLLSKEKEETKCSISVPFCLKCDPTQAGRTYAPTLQGNYECSQCGHTYQIPTPVPEEDKEETPNKWIPIDAFDFAPVNMENVEVKFDTKETCMFNDPDWPYAVATHIREISSSEN